ncbi:MAG TPA: tetratricopeptide repeat protein [Anaeromyxobacteraceae bacterium]|nr:tetratricopeptide repeat protein [Anaeromyxobacteraceae bacterium]
MGGAGALRGRLRPAGIAGAAIAAYLPALRGGFVYDDHLFFEWTRTLRGPLWRIWADASSPDYWPLTLTTFWAEWRLWGPEPSGYHAVNVALHAVAAVLLWRVLLRLRIPGAWLGGLLFAVHPVAVESVAWISERKNVLSGALFLVALLAWLRFDEEGRARDRVLSLAAFALALLAKTSVVMLPPLLLALAWVRRGRLERRDWARAAPFFALALAAGLVTLWFQWQNAMALLWLPPRGPLERLSGAAWALGFYVEKAFLPVGLSFVHPGWPVPPASPLFHLPALLLAAAAAAAWRLRRTRGRPVILAVGFQALMLLPVLGFVEIAYFDVAPVSNHLGYLALMGPCALGGAGLARAAGVRPAVTRPALAAILLGLVASTFSRATAFEDELSLWERAVRDEPGSAYARGKLAVELADRGRREEALFQLREMARVARDPSVREFALSYWHLYQGRGDEAVAHAREALRWRDSPDLRRHLALQLVVTGRSAEAVGILAALVERWPQDADYRLWLGRALAAEGRLEEARQELAAAMELPPGDARVEALLRQAAARPPRRGIGP